MENNIYKKDVLTIDVNKNKYYIEPICNDDNCTRFKVSTQCEYMFTLCLDENRNWQMEDDVTPMDESLVYEIGKAIEHYDGY